MTPCRYPLLSVALRLRVRYNLLSCMDLPSTGIGGGKGNRQSSIIDHQYRGLVFPRLHSGLASCFRRSPKSVLNPRPCLNPKPDKHIGPRGQSLTLDRPRLSGREITGVRHVCRRLPSHLRGLPDCAGSGGQERAGFGFGFHHPGGKEGWAARGGRISFFLPTFGADILREFGAELRAEQELEHGLDIHR